MLFNTNVVPTATILSTLTMEVVLSSETSIVIRAAQRDIPEEGTLHSRHLDNL
jgi:hypothetical protein